MLFCTELRTEYDKIYAQDDPLVGYLHGMDALKRLRVRSNIYLIVVYVKNFLVYTTM